jgi:hypothetical protein
MSDHTSQEQPETNAAPRPSAAQVAAVVEAAYILDVLRP